MRKAGPLLCALLFAAAYSAHGARVLSTKIEYEPDQPIVATATSSGGGLLDKHAFAETAAVFPHKEFDKLHKDINSSLVVTEAKALALSKHFPTATAKIETVTDPADGTISTDASAVGTDLFGKPKLAVVKALINQDQVNDSKDVDKKDLNITKTATLSHADNFAEQAAKKNVASVKIGASTNPFPPAAQTLSLKLGEVSLFNKHGKVKDVAKGNAFDETFVYGKDKLPFGMQLPEPLAEAIAPIAEALTPVAEAVLTPLTEAIPPVTEPLTTP